MDLDYGALVKNYLNEDIKYAVERRKGPVISGNLTPGSQTEILGLNVGDTLHIWNDKLFGKEVLTKPRNAKYIIGYQSMLKEIKFSHQGFHPIIVLSRNLLMQSDDTISGFRDGRHWYRPRYGRPVIIERPVTVVKEHVKEEKKDRSSAIIILLLSIMLIVSGIALFMQSYRYGSVSGSAEYVEPIESIIV